MRGNQSYFSGAAACRSGHGIGSCPFVGGTPQSAEWRRGWHEIAAQRDQAQPDDRTALEIAYTNAQAAAVLPEPALSKKRSRRAPPAKKGAFTADEMTILTTMMRADCGPGVIARKLDREYESVRNKMRRIEEHQRMTDNLTESSKTFNPA